MSDQTPSSTEDLSGSEPSMEDILASIRKIISEDEPVALESPEDAIPVDIVSTDRSSEIDAVLSEFGQAPDDLISDAVDVQPEALASSGDIVDLNIDDILAGLDDDEVSLESVETVEALNVDNLLPETDAATTADVEISHDDDILSLLDGDIPLAEEATAGSIEAADIDIMPDVIPENVIPEKIEASDDVEIDALLDDILMAPEGEIEDFVPNETLEGADAPIAEELVSEEQSDLDLVKSLMADLADDPGGLETEQELDSLLAIPELDDAAELPLEEVSESPSDTVVDMLAESDAVDLDVAEPEEDILGDILDMTLEDELEAHSDDIDLAEFTTLDDVAAAEQDIILENLTEIEPLEEVASIDALPASDDSPSLSDIAAAAEADAVAVESAFAPTVAAAGLTAAAGAGAGFAAIAAKTTVDDIETQSTSATPETPPQSHPTEETSMPVKAVKTDAILDEVTETATSGAFAELNQVVEDKAIFNERGPRIGDLVQEALRPMLKEWLDANLKGIVERAVTKEVKRISKGQ